MIWRGLWAFLVLGAALAGATPASAAWLEARTDHFRVYSDSSEPAIRALATRLERFDKAIRYLHKLPDDDADHVNPLTVYVVSDTAAVRQLYCSGSMRPQTGCQNIAGFYQPRANGSFAFTPESFGRGSAFNVDAQTGLLHEYSHHFMMRNFSAAYPAWYLEGFAEFNSTASFEKDGSIGFGKAPLQRYYWLMKGKPLSLTAMLSYDGRKLSPEQREALYGRGWLLTHYLTFSTERDGQLKAYIKAINAGTPSLDAAKTAFGDLALLDRQLDGYLHRTKLKYLLLAAQAAPAGPVAVRPLSAGEAAVMPARMRSDRGVDRESAAEVVVQARRLAAPYPDDAGAQDALAEAEFDAGNDDLAEAAADRALKVSPNDRVAMVYKGQIHLRRAAKAKATEPAAWSDARSWFIKANRLEPNAAEPLYLYYWSFLAQGAKPTKNAVDGLWRAFEIAPQDPGLRFLLARQTLLDGDAKSARNLLAPLAFDPHGAADSPAARLIALIDANDLAGATAMLSGPPDQQQP